MTDANKERLRELNNRLGVHHHIAVGSPPKARRVLELEQELEAAAVYLDDLAGLYEKKGYSDNAIKFRARSMRIRKVLGVA